MKEILKILEEKLRNSAKDISFSFLIEISCNTKMKLRCQVAGPF